MRARSWWIACVLTLTAAVAGAQPLSPLAKPAAKTEAVALPAAPSATPQLTGQDVESWLDGFMPYALQRGDVAGAVVAVVKDGQPILLKGYGYADVAHHTPVSPDGTLFRPGSVSKLFTWTAVMQLVGEGKIDLDKDVNAYLDFTIPARPGGPITMRRLMTHTPGFEETVQGLLFFNPKRLEPLGDALKAWIPERVYAAGTTPAYSNYGAALAGYIVQRVSGEPFDEYIQRHIFTPLGMDHSSFSEPLPPRLMAGMSKGYEAASLPPKPYELLNLRPAGSLASTGADMAKFMIAHLEAERGGGVLLPAAVAREMHRTYAPAIGPLDRMALGFYESNLNGHEIISHGGDTDFFHSDLNLFIDDGVGIFVSINSAGREDADHQIRTALLNAFADRYFPAPPAPPAPSVPLATARQHAAMIAGTYDNSRGSHSDFVSVVDLLNATKVVAAPDGTITVPTVRGLNGQPIKWREISPFVWKDVAGPWRLAAQVKDGRVSRFSFDEISPFMVFLPSPAWRSSAWLVPALLAGLGALALTGLLWPVTAIVRRRYGAAFALTGNDALSYRASRIGAVVTVLVAAGWVTMVLVGLGNLELLGPALAPWLALLGLLGPLLLLAALAAMVWDAIHVWRRRKGWRGWFARVWSVVLVLGVAVMLWTVAVFHLYGLNSHY